MRVNETVDQVMQYPFWAIDGTNGTHDRGITQETAEYFGIRTGWNEVEQRIGGYYFPVTKGGEITGFIKVDLNASKKSDYRWAVVGDVGVDCDLLGQVQAQKNKGAKLFIVEGVWDLATTYQCLKENAEKHYKKTVHPNVVTFPLGLGDPSKGKTNARQSLVNNLEFVQSYGKPKLTDKGFMAAGVVTCFDNDNPKNDDSIYNVGQEAVKDCSLVLKDFYNVVLPVNDCSDLYKTKGTSELYSHLIFKAKEYMPESIVTGSIGIEELIKPIPPGVRIKCLPELMSKWDGVRGSDTGDDNVEGELTLILAPPNIGKTTVCKEVGYSLIADHNKKVGHIFLEEQIKKTQQSYIALDNNIWLPRFRRDPSLVSIENIKKSEEKMLNNGGTWLDHKKGSLTSKSLMNQLWWMAHTGHSDIVFDHLSFIFSGQNSSNERQDIDQLLTEMALFCMSSGVRLWVVAHIKRIDKKEFVKDDKGMTFLKVSQDQARGSGAFEQLAMNILSMEPQITSDGSRGCFRIRSCKAREWGWLGIADYLTLHPQTGRVVPYVHEEEEY